MNYQLLQTQDYDIFQKIKFNRQLDSNNIRKLKESIESIGLQMPILCAKSKNSSNKYDVIDGQHRLAVLKTLNMNVPFLISKVARLDHLDTLQISKTWSLWDYLCKNAILGDDVSQKAKETAERWSLETNCKLTKINALHIIDARNNLYKDIKQNNLKIDINNGVLIKMALQICDNPPKPNRFRNGYNTRLIRTFKKLNKKYKGIDLKIIERMNRNNYLNIFTVQQENDEYWTEMYIKYLKLKKKKKIK